MARFPKPLRLVASESAAGGGALDEAEEKKIKEKRAKALLREMPAQLESLAKKMRETVEAVDNGEVELEDFAWESELESKYRGGR